MIRFQISYFIDGEKGSRNSERSIVNSCDPALKKKPTMKLKKNENYDVYLERKTSNSYNYLNVLFVILLWGFFNE